MALTLTLPTPDRALAPYTLRGHPPVKPAPGVKFNRIAYSAAHVVSDPLAAVDPWLTAAVDWDDWGVWGGHWNGGDIDLDRPLPSDVITAVTAVDPSLMAVVGPYFAMLALPETLRAVEPRAREIYAGGWRPPVPEGPSRSELSGLVGARAA